MDKYLTVFCTFIEVLRSEYLKSRLCWEVQDIWSSWLWGFDSFHRFISPLCILPSPQNRGAINLFHNNLLRIYFFFGTVQFSSVQSLSHVLLFATPWTAARQASLSITNCHDGVHPNPCPLSWWCHPTISSSVIPFSSCPQSFPASGSFQMSQFFASVLEFQLQHQSFQWIPRTDLL